MAAFSRDPLERTDVIGVFSDCEETGLGGATAWVAARAHELDVDSTLVVSLDWLPRIWIGTRVAKRTKLENFERLIVQTTPLLTK